MRPLMLAASAKAGVRGVNPALPAPSPSPGVKVRRSLGLATVCLTTVTVATGGSPAWAGLVDSDFKSPAGAAGPGRAHQPQ